MRCFIGVDDTDSLQGHCTTYLGYVLVGWLMRRGCAIPAYPRLVRLNPNIPFKTRGNAAVGIEFECEEPGRIFEGVRSLVESNSDVRNGANSGVVFAEGEAQLPLFRSIYGRALNGVVNKDGVLSVLRESGVGVFTLGNGMGVVGASASLGFDPSGDDHTYELLAYRRSLNCGTPREIGAASVRRMDSETFPCTFSNLDYESGRVLIAPHGPDPVFAGVRGDSPGCVLEGFRRLEFQEELEGRMVYVSNQGTDAHLARRLQLPLKGYSSGALAGTVASVRKGEGGHLYLTVAEEGGGGTFECAVYEPSGDLRRAAQRLVPGDVVEVAGGVRCGTSRHPPVLNAERIRVVSVADAVRRNPVCEGCGVRMKSEGRGKGFQCRRCGRRLTATEAARGAPAERGALILPGVYLPSPRAHRHLTRPFVRYRRRTPNRDSRTPLEGWFVGAAMRAPVRSRR